MIEIAAILSLLGHHWADFAIIVVLVIVNAVMGADPRGCWNTVCELFSSASKI